MTACCCSILYLTLFLPEILQNKFVSGTSAERLDAWYSGGYKYKITFLIKQTQSSYCKRTHRIWNNTTGFHCFVSLHFFKPQRKKCHLKVVIAAWGTTVVVEFINLHVICQLSSSWVKLGNEHDFMPVVHLLSGFLDTCRKLRKLIQVLVNVSCPGIANNNYES